METNEIKELIEQLRGTDYSYVEIKHEGSHLILSRESIGEKSKSAPISQTIESTPAVIAKTEVTSAKVSVAEDKDCYIVKSPIVGTFYASAGPEVGPYVKKGDVVKKGDILCIIEAMKLMNEIDCDVNGEIVEILISNEAIVEYGQPLFKICLQ